MSSVLMVVAQKDFRDEELFDTRRELTQAGSSVSIASARGGTCHGMLGGSVEATEALEAVDPERFDAVVFVGGRGARSFFDDPDAARIAWAMHREGKVVAAICLAPVILANAGLLSGKRATVFGSESKTLKARGANYEGPGVIVDGDIVTADGPEQAVAFGRAVAGLLAARGAPHRPVSKRPRAETD